MLTSSAAAKVRELVEAEGDPDLALRLAVRPGGCSGFSYEMYFDAQVDATDVVSETDGVRLDVYGSSGDYLGSGIDGMEVQLQGRPAVINTQDLLETLRGEGFDVVILDFTDATDYLQLNSFVLLDAEAVRTRATLTSSDL